MLNLAWIFIWDRSSVAGYDGLVILAFFILVSIAVTNIAVGVKIYQVLLMRMMIRGINMIRIMHLDDDIEYEKHCQI